MVVSFQLVMFASMCWGCVGRTQTADSWTPCQISMGTSQGSVSHMCEIFRMPLVFSRPGFYIHGGYLACFPSHVNFIHSKIWTDGTCSLSFWIRPLASLTLLATIPDYKVNFCLPCKECLSIYNSIKWVIATKFTWSTIINIAAHYQVRSDLLFRKLTSLGAAPRSFLLWVHFFHDEGFLSQLTANFTESYFF